MRSLGLVVMFVLAGVAMVPQAEAHQDGCLAALHVSPLQVHQLCFTNPHTCFSNGQMGGAEVHLHCTEPDPHPCILKGKVEGNQVRICP